MGETYWHVMALIGWFLVGWHWRTSWKRKKKIKILELKVKIIQAPIQFKPGRARY